MSNMPSMKVAFLPKHTGAKYSAKRNLRCGIKETEEGETLAVDQLIVVSFMISMSQVRISGRTFINIFPNKSLMLNFLQAIFTGEPSGRLLKYNPVTKETTVLLRGIQFPNGVSLSKDESFLLFCETARSRLTKYWLKGEKTGTTELFALLPGAPDNVRTNEKGEFWVAIHCRRRFFTHFFAVHPNFRKSFLKLPIPTKIQYLLHIGGRLHGLIIKYGADGKLLKILEDRQGKVVRAVSEVEERDGKLWIGSVLMPFIAVYDDGEH